MKQKNKSSKFNYFNPDQSIEDPFVGSKQKSQVDKSYPSKIERSNSEISEEELEKISDLEGSKKKKARSIPKKHASSTNFDLDIHKLKERKNELEDMKDETRIMFSKLQEKTYIENAEYKKDVNEQIKRITNNFSSIKDDVTGLKQTLEKIDLKKLKGNDDLSDKVQKIELELISHKVKNNYVDKKMTDFIDKTSKVIDDNLKMNGLIGEYNKFKDLKSLLEYLLTHITSSSSIREKANLEYQNFKEKLEGKVNSIQNKFDLQEKSIKSQIYSKIDLTEAGIRNTIEQLKDLINEVRLENTKSAVKLIQSSDELSNEIKISLEERKQLENIFKTSSESIKSSFNEVIQNYDSQLLESNTKINDLSTKNINLNKEIGSLQEQLKKSNSSIEALQKGFLEINNKIKSLSSPSKINKTQNSFNFNNKEDQQAQTTINKNYIINTQQQDFNKTKFYSSLILSVSSIKFSIIDKQYIEEEITNKLSVLKPISHIKTKSNPKIINNRPSNETIMSNNDNKQDEKTNLLLNSIQNLTDNFTDFKIRVVRNFETTESSIQNTQVKLRESFDYLHSLLNNRHNIISENNSPAETGNLIKSSLNIKANPGLNNSHRGHNKSSKSLIKSMNGSYLNYENILKDLSLPTNVNSNLMKITKPYENRVSNRYPSQKKDFENSLINKIKEELDSDNFNSQLSVQVLDPHAIKEYNKNKYNKFRHGNNTHSTNAVLKPKNLTNYMKFNLVDIKK